MRKVCIACELAVVVLVGVLLFLPARSQPVPGSITLVNQANSVGSPIAITTPTAGNMLVLTACHSGGTGSENVTAVSGGGVTWAKAKDSTVNTNSAIWYGLNSSGSGASITVTLSAGATFDYVVSEFSGIATSSALDQSGSAQNSGTDTSTTATITTTSANEVVIATACGPQAAPASSGPGPTNSFTILTSPGNHSRHAYRIVSSTGSYSTAWKWSDVVTGDQEIASFTAPTANTRVRHVANTTE